MTGIRVEEEPIRLRDHEPTPTTFSVGIVLTYDPGIHNLQRLVLVQQRISKKWGIIAGGVKTRFNAHTGLAERPREGAIRELLEETGLPLEVITPIYLAGTMIVPSEGKMRLGWIYQSEIDVSSSEHEADLKSNYNLIRGFVPKNSEEIFLVRAFTQNQVHGLITHPKRLYKPEFNLPVLRRWLYEILADKCSPWDGDSFAEMVVSGRYGLDRSASEIFIER